MATLEKANEILEKIKELKRKLTEAQDYYHAAQMRDMEKAYLRAEVKTEMQVDEETKKELEGES